jgi:hypothetical protein
MPKGAAWCSKFGDRWETITFDDRDEDDALYRLRCRENRAGID